MYKGSNNKFIKKGGGERKKKKKKGGRVTLRQGINNGKKSQKEREELE